MGALREGSLQGNKLWEGSRQIWPGRREGQTLRSEVKRFAPGALRLGKGKES